MHSKHQQQQQLGNWFIQQTSKEAHLHAMDGSVQDVLGVQQTRGVFDKLNACDVCGCQLSCHCLQRPPFSNAQTQHGSKLCVSRLFLSATPAAAEVSS